MDHTIDSDVSQLVVRQMSIKGVLSLVLYHMGDHVCEQLFRKDIRMMCIHKLYSNLMLWSHRLDRHDEVWNVPGDGMLIPKHLRDEDESISQV